MIDVDWIVPQFRLDPHRKKNRADMEKRLSEQTDITIHRYFQRQDYQEIATFNKGWMLNKAVRISKSPHLIIADMDADWGHDPMYVFRFVLWAIHKGHKWAFGWQRYLYLTEDGKGYERDDWPYPGIQEGGIVYFKRELWEEMGGANEWIKELRGPDNDIAMRAMYLTKEYPCYPYTLKHRWHPHSPMKQTKFKKHNKDILKYTAKNPQKVINMLRAQQWGDKLKPYCFKESFYECRGRFGYV